MNASSQSAQLATAATEVASRRSRRSFWGIFGMPTVLGVISTVGLISALVGDGIYDVISWITLTIPVVVIVRSIWGQPG